MQPAVRGVSAHAVSIATDLVEEYGSDAWCIARYQKEEPARATYQYTRAYTATAILLQEGTMATPTRVARAIGRRRATLTREEIVARRDCLHDHGYALLDGRFRKNPEAAAREVRLRRMAQLDTAWMREENWDLRRLAEALDAT